MYDIRTDIKYGPFEKVDLGGLADEAPSKWWPRLGRAAPERSRSRRSG